MILAIDQGTTGTTCLLVDDALAVRGRGYAPVSLSTPRPGWVEQDPGELWASVERAETDGRAPRGGRPTPLHGAVSWARELITRPKRPADRSLLVW